MLRQDGLIHETEVYLSHGKVHLGMPRIRNGEDPAWFVITPVNPETKLPMTDQACCSKLISAICSQLEEFGAMSFDSASKKRMNGITRQRVMGRQSLKEKGQEEDQLQEMEGHLQKASSGNYK